MIKYLFMIFSQCRRVVCLQKQILTLTIGFLKLGESLHLFSVLAAGSVITSVEVNWSHHRFPFWRLLICPTFYYNII